MSINTLLGVLFGLGLVILAIGLATDDFLIFFSFPSFIMVVGGTFAATFISYESRYVMLSLRDMFRILMVQRVGRNILNFEVGRIIRWGYVVQAKGPIALEQEISKIKKEDPLLGFGVELVITGYTGQEVSDIMANTVESSFGRSVVQAAILRSMAAAAPAFGMIGTLIGLIVMLQNIGGDPRQLGSGLALALITTLYGVLMARLVFGPAAAKIQQREEIKRFRNLLVAEGLALLADKKSPRFIQDSMNSYLDPKIHFDIDQQLKKKAGARAA